jgi:hypothetical protein
MKGKLMKSELGWVVVTTEQSGKTYSWVSTFALHPDDVKQINLDSLVFDNIEGRIESYPDVEFELIDIWENGQVGINGVTYAKLKSQETLQEKTYTKQEIKMLLQKAYNKITRRMGLTYSPSAFELQKEVDELIKQN